MAAPSLTYTLTNGTTADASQVMQNFNDLLNGYTDGTKDLSISALTCAGTATLNGNVALGNASGDDITHTGSLASSIPIKTNNTYDIGSATLGLRKLYLGNGGAGATCDIVSASHATTREYTVPDCGAAADFVMTQVAQTISGVKTFSSGINLGNTTLTNYQEGTQATTFTWDGGGSPGTSGSVTIQIVRVGNEVTIRIPAATATTGTTSTTLTANTALPSWARPASLVTFAYNELFDNGAGVVTAGAFRLSTAGVLSLFKATAFTNTAAGGMNVAAVLTFSLL